MHGRFRWLSVAWMVAISATLVWAAPIEGRWRLVEQTYGSGQGNLTRAEEPLHLEFRNEAGKLVGKLWAGDDRSAVRDWPTISPTDRPQPVTLEQSLMVPGSDHVHVRYRVAPAPGDDLVLHVTEQYRVEASGTTLVGSVHVEFERQGESRGSYTLKRRFERQP